MYTQYKMLVKQTAEAKDLVEQDIKAQFGIKAIVNEGGISLYTDNFNCYLFYTNEIEVSSNNCGTAMPTPEAYKLMYIEAEDLRKVAEAIKERYSE